MLIPEFIEFLGLLLELLARSAVLNFEIAVMLLVVAIDIVRLAESLISFRKSADLILEAVKRLTQLFELLVLLAEIQVTCLERFTERTCLLVLVVYRLVQITLRPVFRVYK